MPGSPSYSTMLDVSTRELLDVLALCLGGTVFTVAAVALDRLSAAGRDLRPAR